MLLPCSYTGLWVLLQRLARTDLGFEPLRLFIRQSQSRGQTAREADKPDNLGSASCSSCQTLMPGIRVPKHKTQLTCCSPSLTPPGDTILHSLHFKKWSHFKRYKKEKIKLGERKMRKHREITVKIEQVPSKLFFFIVSTWAELTWTNDKTALQHRSALKCLRTELFCPALT